jgi:hypothetical protein
MPAGSATTADALALVQTLKQDNDTLHQALWKELRLLTNQVFKEAAATPLVKWHREFERFKLSSGPFSGSSDTPDLQFNKNVTDQVKKIVTLVDKTVNPDDFLEDARIIIREEMELLLGKSGLRCYVSSGSEAYLKEHDLGVECKGKLVVVTIMYQV